MLKQFASAWQVLFPDEHSSLSGGTSLKKGRWVAMNEREWVCYTGAVDPIAGEPGVASARKGAIEIDAIRIHAAVVSGCFGEALIGIYVCVGGGRMFETKKERD